MNQYIASAAGLLVAYTLYSLVSSFVSNRQHARRAKELGCLPPPLRPYKYPLGIDTTRAVIQADKNHTVPSHFFEIYHDVGEKATWFQNALGTMMYFTCDPKNIQAVLATQFQDFEIGAQRRVNFFPMLGNGIFTSDGKAW